jgi:hypothetical protein
MVQHNPDSDAFDKGFDTNFPIVLDSDEELQPTYHAFGYDGTMMSRVMQGGTDQDEVRTPNPFSVD